MTKATTPSSTPAGRPPGTADDTRVPAGAPARAPAGTPAQPSAATRREWWALAVLCFTMLLVTVDQTVLNVALPTLIGALHPSTSGLQWIVDSYTLTNAVLLLFGGAVADRVGRKRTFLAGLAVFGLGSLFSALVGSSDLLIVARTVMGAGAAFLAPATLSIIVSTFGGAQRAQAIGIWSGVSGIGAAVGPLLGGFLLEHFWWGSVFLINVPIAVVAFVGGAVVIRETRAERPAPIDPIGVVLSSGGLALLTYALIVAPNKHWSSAIVITALVGAVVLLAGFARWDRRRPSPLIDLELFRNKTFSTALLAVSATFFALLGTSFLLGQYIQLVQGVDAFGVGLRFLPSALATLVAGTLAARLTARFGLRAVLVTGIVLDIAGLAIFTAVSGSTGFAIVGVGFALLGFGIGLVVAPASTAIMSAIPLTKVGAGSGLRSMVQLLGGSFGVAILGSIATSHYRSHVGDALSGSAGAQVPQAAHGAVQDQIGSAAAVAGRLPAEVSARVHHIANEAFVSGLHLVCVVAIIVLALAALAASRYIPGRVGGQRPGAQQAPAAPK